MQTVRRREFDSLAKFHYEIEWLFHNAVIFYGGKLLLKNVELKVFRQDVFLKYIHPTVCTVIFSFSLGENKITNLARMVVLDGQNEVC